MLTSKRSKRFYRGFELWVATVCLLLLSCPEAKANFAAPVIQNIKLFYREFSSIIFICGCVSLFYGIAKLMLDPRADVKWPITVSIILMVLGAFDLVVRTIGVPGW